MEKILIIREKEVASIVFKEEWRDIPLVIYASGLGKVRDLIGRLPLIKKLNVKFFLDSAVKENYEAVQILSSLGVYAGIVMNENADWEKLTDLMYYALCTRVPHAPVEPFQYVYEMYQRNRLVDYEKVFSILDGDCDFTTEDTRFSHFGGGRGRSYHKKHNIHPLPPPAGENLLPLPPPKGDTQRTQSFECKEYILCDPCEKSLRPCGKKNVETYPHSKAWQEFFYEATPCAACEGWRICLGKFAAMEDKTGCRNFTVEWLNLVESIKFKKQTL
jgi:hypothetical protein